MGELRTLDGRRSKQRVKADGYRYYYYRTEDGKQKTVTVRKLIAETFLEPIDGKRYVSSINGDKEDLRAENLKWASASEVVLDRKDFDKILLHNNKPVRQLELNGKLIKKWDSATIAAR